MKRIRLLIMSILALVVWACETGQEIEAPLVFTGDITMDSDTSAVFHAKISNFGQHPILESGFVWGLDSTFKSSIKLKNETNDAAVYSLETNVKLLPEMTYYVRAYVKTEQFVSYGRTESFDSPPGYVNPGKWSSVTGNGQGYGWCMFINSIFTIGNTSYFILEKGELYSYQHTTNTFRLEVKNTILSYADFTIVANGNAYILSQNSFYLFQSQSKTFTRLSSYPWESDILWRSGFNTGDDIYIGLGVYLSIGGSNTQDDYSKDWWKYNIPTDTWQKVASFPGEYRSDGFGFTLDDKGYVGGGFNLIEPQWPYPKFNDLWSYSPENDQWEQKASLPIHIDDIHGLFGATIGNTGYCFYNNQLFEYHQQFDVWLKRTDLDIKRKLCWPKMFAAHGKLYVVEIKENDNVKSLNMWAYEK